MMMRPESVLFHVRSLPDRLKEVAIIGCGRIGSHAALKLAGIGVRRFVLIDNDRITEDNISSGHLPYTFFDLDRFKADALKGMLEKKSGRIKAASFRMEISPDISGRMIDRVFGNSVLIVWAVDTRKGLRATENFELMISRLSVIPAMHADNGGGHVITYIPMATTSCPKHSMGIKSFDEIIEGSASESKITKDDIKVVSDCTAQIVEAMLFRRFRTRWSGIDFNRNYLHIENLGDGRYRKIWMRPKKSDGCILCDNLLT